MGKFILQFAVLTIALTGCNPSDRLPKEPELPASFVRLKKPADVDTLIGLLNRLDTSYHEEKRFWEEILNDSGLSVVHRKMCAVKFIQRFARPGTPLQNLPDISMVIDTGKTMSGFLYELDTVLKRKVIRGGNWKDIGYYLHAGIRQYDPLYTVFTEKMRKLGYRVFYINFVQYDYLCTRCVLPDYSAGFQLAIKGNISEDELKSFLIKHELPAKSNLIIKGVYPVMAHDGKDDEL